MKDWKTVEAEFDHARISGAAYRAKLRRLRKHTFAWAASRDLRRLCTLPRDQWPKVF